MDRTSKYAYLFFLLGSLLFSLLHCGKEGPETISENYVPEDVQTGGSIILKVEDSTYYNSDFENYLRSIVGNAKEDLNDDTLSRLFNKFVDEKTLLQAARNAGMFLTSEEEKEHLAKLRSQFWSEDRNLEDLDTQIIFDKLLIEKYIFELVKEIGIENREIKEYYELHKKEFLQSERVWVSQILVKTEDKAVEILERLKDKSEEEFRAIAQQESIGPEASKGGEMGWFEMGQLPYEMESVVFSLKEGELSKVVESSYGFHIFRLDRRNGPELIPLEKASGAIRLKLLDQKIRDAISAHIEELKKTLSWETKTQNLSFNYKR